MLENTFLGLYNLKNFCGLLSRWGLYKSPSSNLGTVKFSVDHWCAGITGPAGQWNKKLRSNPVKMLGPRNYHIVLGILEGQAIDRNLAHNRALVLIRGSKRQKHTSYKGQAFILNWSDFFPSGEKNGLAEWRVSKALSASLLLFKVREKFHPKTRPIQRVLGVCSLESFEIWCNLVHSQNGKSLAQTSPENKYTEHFCTHVL